jgi:hypothetical protein
MAPQIATVTAMLRWRRVGWPLAAAVVAGLFFGGASNSARAESSLNTVHEIYAALRACWVPPQDLAQAGVRVTVRLSFKRNGEVLGEPLIAYENPDATEDERSAIRAAVTATLQRCGQLPLSAELGDIIAGHPINVRLGEGWRRRGGTENPH